MRSHLSTEEAVDDDGIVASSLLAALRFIMKDVLQCSEDLMVDVFGVFAEENHENKESLKIDGITAADAQGDNHECWPLLAL